jgi:hypothetical protein
MSAFANSVNELGTRRDCLKAAAVGVVGAGLGRVSPGESGAAIASESRSPIRSCVVLYQYGGPSQLETFDPKPNAPSEIRGEFATIATSVAGVRFGEHLPRMAQRMDRMALVRSVHHPMRNHNSAAAETLTGRTPSGGDLELLADDGRSYPSLGSLIAYGLGVRAHALPFVALPYAMVNVVQLPGQTPGILGGKYDRFQVQGDPQAEDFRVAALAPPAGRTERTMVDREQLFRRLDRESGLASAQKSMTTYQERALQLIRSERLRSSFDMALEPAAVRDRYGRTLFGQSTLLARKLVEEGINCVSVFNGQHNGQDANWDSHANIFPRHRQLIPPYDQALSALIDDLTDRGLLESTLVVSMAEFGRTPKINGTAGRDHWPDCYTVCFAGGGIRAGAVHGASDRIAAYPDRDPITPGDLVATILWRFGIDPEGKFHDPSNRPYRLAEGRPLRSLFE